MAASSPAQSELCALLTGLVRERLLGPAAQWYEEALAAAAGDPDGNGFLTAFAGAGRRLGRMPLEPSITDRARLGALGVPVLPPGLGRDECGRAVLLLEATSRLDAASSRSLVEGLFYRGEVRERQAVLWVLPYLPRPADFVEVAVEACRTSLLPVFEAMACENPYPARHFPERSFDQMVLKALFLGVPVERILDLDRRLTDELVRMVEGYASERRAAGRSVPQDVAWITGRATRSPEEHPR